jgi:hypothetical protein
LSDASTSRAAEAARTLYLRYGPVRFGILSAAAQRIPLASLATQARALSLWDGKRVVPGDETQLALVMDLGVLAPLGPNQRAIDRQAKAAPPAAGTDEAAVLAALQEARFGLFRHAGRDAAGGVRLEPLTGEPPAWLMDAYFEATGVPDSVIGLRLVRFDGFALSCGFILPVSAELLEILLQDRNPSRARVRPRQTPGPDDPALAALFAEPAAVAKLATLGRDPLLAPKCYRAAIDLGLLGPVPGRTDPG